jgi:hypothetical protein
VAEVDPAESPRDVRGGCDDGELKLCRSFDPAESPLNDRLMCEAWRGRVGWVGGDEVDVKKVLKLMADYHCFPLWKACGEIGNINPDDLPLANDLREDLLAWATAYDKTLNQEYPPDSGFASPQEEEAFEVEGRRLWRELQTQLGRDYKVVYFSERDRKLDE